jgi:hypothetical protein
MGYSLAKSETRGLCRVKQLTEGSDWTASTASNEVALPQSTTRSSMHIADNGILFMKRDQSKKVRGAACLCYMDHMLGTTPLVFPIW